MSSMVKALELSPKRPQGFDRMTPARTMSAGAQNVLDAATRLGAEGGAGFLTAARRLPTAGYQLSCTCGLTSVS